jgi:hypothetical protein
MVLWIEVAFLIFEKILGGQQPTLPEMAKSTTRRVMLNI